MSWLALVLVSFGIVSLCLSLHSAFKICRVSEQIGWRILFGLILFFILGYGAFAAYLFEHIGLNWLNIGIASILFFGSIFVLLVNHLAKQSLEALNRIVENERYHAKTDFLTKLHNREHFVLSAEDKIAQRQPFSIMLIDLNNF